VLVENKENMGVKRLEMVQKHPSKGVFNKGNGNLGTFLRRSSGSLIN